MISKLLPPRPRLTQTVFTLIVASYILFALNQGFWNRLLSQFPGLDARGIGFGFAAFALTVLLLEFFGPGPMQKPIAAIFILIAAAAGYYERNFGVLIDRDMVRNIFETTGAESRHLVTARMVATLALTGALPTLLVFWPRIERGRPARQLWRWPLSVIASIALFTLAVFSHYKDYSAMLRERHDVMTAYQPGATLVAGLRYAREQWKSADPVVAPYGRDAKPGPRLAAAEKPVLLVLYVGETARAQNFGLISQGRDTTPELRSRNVVAFTKTTACGTSTAVSVPCMFSGLGRAGYSRSAALARENLLDVLTHAGLDVAWHDNNTGDQKLATRIGWNRIDRTLTPEVCNPECTDEVFLPLIRQTAERITRNTVLVLHMIGSHGPAYHLRYPNTRAAFQPECRSAQFSDCTTAEIENAYDNTIFETDFVLARSIDILAASERVIPAMVYLSDHGESLGENGLYLHAAPAFMAPSEQTEVPFLLWLDPRYSAAMGLDMQCMQARAAKPASHDNLFSTVLGLLNIESDVRDSSLDLVSPCRIGDLI